MARVISCKHCGCNRSFASEVAMLQHFAVSHTCTTDADRLQCRKCGRSFKSNPALEQHCHDLHGMAAVFSSPPQQRLACMIRRQLAEISITDLSYRLIMAAMTLIGIAMTLIGAASHRCIVAAMTLICVITLMIGGSTHDAVVSSPLKPATTHDGKDQINDKEVMTKKVACDDCGDSFKSFDALHQHQWDKPYHTRVSRRRMPGFCSNIRECAQCVEVFSGAEELQQHFIRVHPLTEITFNTGDERSTDTWMQVAEKFKLAWKLPVTTAAPLRIFKVNNMGGRRRKFEQFRAELKTQMAQIKRLDADEEGEELDVRRRVLDDGNELQRYHGTTVKCGLGRFQSGADSTSSSDGNLRLCSLGGCGLCGILKDGFRSDKCRVSRFQRFGRGTYVSATSSKADGYVRMDDCADDLKVMLVAKVLAGRMYRSAHNLTHLARAPLGFHSVQGVPGPVLNYDELVLYDDRAILPNYVIFYHVGAPLG